MNSRVRLVPASSRHIGRIASRMREIDRLECGAFDHSPKQGLRHGFLRSSIAWTVLVDGQPEAMLGVVVESVLGRRGTPWMLGTDEVYRYGRELLMWGPGILSRLHGNSNLRLANVVSAQNDRAIRLLEKWGFTVHEERQMIGGIEFRVFEREAV